MFAGSWQDEEETRPSEDFPEGGDPGESQRNSSGRRCRQGREETPHTETKATIFPQNDHQQPDFVNIERMSAGWKRAGNQTFPGWFRGASFQPVCVPACRRLIVHLGPFNMFPVPQGHVDTLHDPRGFFNAENFTSGFFPINHHEFPVTLTPNTPAPPRLLRFLPERLLKSCVLKSSSNRHHFAAAYQTLF